MTDAIARDLEALAARLTPAERAVRAAAFRLLLHGEPADPSEVIAVTGLPAETK